MLERNVSAMPSHQVWVVLQVVTKVSSPDRDMSGSEASGHQADEEKDRETKSEEFFEETVIKALL